MNVTECRSYSTTSTPSRPTTLPPPHLCKVGVDQVWEVCMLMLDTLMTTWSESDMNLGGSASDSQHHQIFNERLHTWCGSTANHRTCAMLCIFMAQRWRYAGP